MTNEVKQREFEFVEGVSDDTILAMLVGELMSWLRGAEAAEAALAALTQEPKDTTRRSAFDEATQAFLKMPTDWIELHVPEKAPDADLPAQMSDIAKLFQRVDFLLMADSTLPEGQALSGVRARLRGQAEKIKMALDQFAAAIRGMVG